MQGHIRAALHITRKTAVRGRDGCGH